MGSCHCAVPPPAVPRPTPPRKSAGDGQLEGRVEKLENAVREMTRLLRELAKRQKGTSEDTAPRRNETARETPVSQKPATAHVTVRLPADARLYVDDVLCPLTSGTRSFHTPKLEPGKRYFYTLRMEITRDGEVQSETRRVVVTAGQSVQVDFTQPQPVSTVRQ